MADGRRLIDADPAVVAVAFSAALRRGGLTVSLDASATFVAALDTVDISDGEQVYWAARTVLVTRNEDLPVFDATFAAFFGSFVVPMSARMEPETVAVTFDDGPEDDGTDGDDGDDTEVDPGLQVRFSRTETLRSKDFAVCDEDELAEAWALMSQLRWSGAPRRSRRRVPTRHGHGRPDLRRTVQRALRTGGEPVHRPSTRHGQRFRRVVFLVDVSGSMEAYARSLLRFTHAAVSARSQVEVFALGTRLTRLTRELSRRQPDDALAAAGAQVADFGGGTRLGEGLAAFNDAWGVRGMARGAVIVVLSDGWERGDPEQISEQMARLSRVAHRIVWVNPLKATPGYAPLARGMAAAMPYVDAFVEGHSVDALADLGAVLAGEAPDDAAAPEMVLG